MTAAEYLTDWKRQYRLTDREAAKWCRLATSTFRRQRRGEVKRCDQTVALAELYPMVNVAWLDVAEAAMKAAKAFRPRLSRPAETAKYLS